MEQLDDTNPAEPCSNAEIEEENDNPSLKPEETSSANAGGNAKVTAPVSLRRVKAWALRSVLKGN